MEPAPQNPKEQTTVREREITDMLAVSRDLSEEYSLRLGELNLQEKSEILGFRKKWSNNLLWLVVLIVVFNAVFLVLIGKDVLIYRDEWLVRIIFAGSFIEVLGLARIVVEFLFKNPEKK